MASDFWEPFDGSDCLAMSLPTSTAAPDRIPRTSPVEKKLTSKRSVWSSFAELQWATIVLRHWETYPPPPPTLPPKQCWIFNFNTDKTTQITAPTRHWIGRPGISENLTLHCWSAVLYLYCVTPVPSVSPWVAKCSQGISHIRLGRWYSNARLCTVCHGCSYIKWPQWLTRGREIRPPPG